MVAAKARPMLLTEERIQGLRYVQRSKEIVDLAHFPDFLLIGPQRTGTNWLYDNLREHPQIFMSEPKETYYFNLLNKPTPIGHVHSNDLCWYLTFFQDSPASFLKKSIRSLMRFGELYDPKIRGEGTASYAAMGRDLIREVVHLNPDIKAILLMRNPIERAWSHAKKDLVRDRSRRLGEVSDREFETFFRSSYQISCGSYTGILEKWRACLKEGNLFVGFFDDIRLMPEMLLRRVLEFLEVSAKPKYITSSVYERFNTTQPDPIPQKHLRLLRQLFGREIQRLNETYGLNWE